VLLQTSVRFPFCPAPPSTLTRFPYTTLFRSLAGPVGEIGRRPPGRAPHPAPELVELGQAEGLGVFNDQGVGVGQVDARLDDGGRSEEHTSELQSRFDLVCRLMLDKL